MAEDSAALWSEAKESRARQDALREDLNAMQVQVAQLSAQVANLTAMFQESEASRKEFRKMMDDRLTEIAEARGAKNALKWVVGFLLSVAGLAGAYHLGKQ